jgi:hypothetical protein
MPGVEMCIDCKGSGYQLGASKSEKKKGAANRALQPLRFPNSTVFLRCIAARRNKKARRLGRAAFGFRGL